MLAALVVAFVAGFPTPVSCVPDTDEFGGITAPDRSVQIIRPLCDALTKPRSKLFAFAVFTATHEAEHVKGIADEHDADCAALAALPAVLTRFWPRLGPLWRDTVQREARRIHQHAPWPYYGACP